MKDLILVFSKMIHVDKKIARIGDKRTQDINILKALWQFDPMYILLLESVEDD